MTATDVRTESLEGLDFTPSCDTGKHKDERPAVALIACINNVPDPYFYCRDCLVLLAKLWYDHIAKYGSGECRECDNPVTNWRDHFRIEAP